LDYREEAAMSLKRVHVVVWGYVQGVGFRVACQRQANSLGVKGWVRNRPDGSVEALFQGDTDAVDAMSAWCRHGPANADVEEVEITELATGDPGGSFSIR
jgi:acylphosphatase